MDTDCSLRETTYAVWQETVPHSFLRHFRFKWLIGAGESVKVEERKKQSVISVPRTAFIIMCNLYRNPRARY